MNISSTDLQRLLNQRTLYPFRFLLLAMLAIMASLSMLLSGQAQRAMATGSSVIVQINGPAGQPVFTPALLTIHLYDTVNFLNQSPVPYAVAADDNSFSSPAIPHNHQWSTTFSVLGAHSYHATLSTSSSVALFGEILVVADSVALLATPQPQIEATALAIIQAGKHPPDVIQLPTTMTTAPIVHHTTTTSILTLLLSRPVLLGAGAVLGLLFIILGIIIFRRKHHIEDDEDEELLDEEPISKRNHQPVLASASQTATATITTSEVNATPGKVKRFFERVRTRLTQRRKKSEEDEDYEDEA